MKIVRITISIFTIVYCQSRQKAWLNKHWRTVWNILVYQQTANQTLWNMKRGPGSIWFIFNKGSAACSWPQINPWWRPGRCMFRLSVFDETLHITISLVKQELLYGRKMTSEHKVPLRGAAFCLCQMQRAPQVQIPKVTFSWNLQ